MKYYLFVLIFLLTISFAACQEQEFSKADLDTKIDSVSYAIGMDVGTNFKTQMVEIETDAFYKGLKDALADSLTDTLMTQTQMQATLQAYQMELMQKQQAMRTESAAKNKSEGEEFLAENKSKENVQVTESGLQYIIEKEGTGASPDENDQVKVNYEGKLLNGKVFDSSYERGEPATFVVNQVIPGWTEALQKMKVGGKWKIFIPSDLAYAERGAGNVIEPHSTLIFDVELLDVEKK